MFFLGDVMIDFLEYGGEGAHCRMSRWPPCPGRRRAYLMLELRQILAPMDQMETGLRMARGEVVQIIQAYFDQWGLSPAERDVALLLLKGVDNESIAEMRGTAKGTVSAQSAAIYAKASVDGRAQLISLFLEELLAGEAAPSTQPANRTGPPEHPRRALFQDPRQVQPVFAGAVDRVFVAGIGVAHDARGRIVPQHAFEALGGLVGAVGSRSPCRHAAKSPCRRRRRDAATPRSRREAVFSSAFSSGQSQTASEPSFIASVSRLGEATEPESRWSRPITTGAFSSPLRTISLKASPSAVAVAEPDPADARRQALKGDALARHVEPVVQVRVVGDQLLHLGVGLVDVLGIAGQGHPAERADAAAEQRADIGGHEARERRRHFPAPRPWPPGGCCCRNRASARPRSRSRPSPRHAPSCEARAAFSTAFGSLSRLSRHSASVQPCGR